MGSLGLQTYYDILGVEPSATKEDIKRAYHEIARVYHPDSNFYDEILGNMELPEQEELSPEQLAKFQEITAAYETLIDQVKREQYDASIPKNIRSWDTSTELAVPEDKLREALQEGKERPFAMGTFGQAQKVDDASIMEQVDPELRSVSDILAVKRSPFRRLLALFGL